MDRDNTPTPKSFSRKDNINASSQLKPISLILIQQQQSQQHMSINVTNNKKPPIQPKPTAFKCNYKDCTEQFRRNRDLKEHKLKHQSERPFGCDKCCKRFKNRNKLTNHKCKTKKKNFKPVKNNSKYKYECAICHMKFPKSQALAGHMNSHRNKNQEALLNSTQTKTDTKTKSIHRIVKGSKLLIPDGAVDIDGKELKSHLLHTVKHVDRCRNSITSQEHGDINLLHTDYYIVDCNVKDYSVGQMVASRWPVNKKSWIQYYIGHILKIEHDKGNSLDVKYHVRFPDSDDIVSKIIGIAETC